MSDSSQDQASFNSQDDLFAPIEDEHCISMTPISKTRDQQSRLGSDFNESTDTEDYMKVCLIVFYKIDCNYKYINLVVILLTHNHNK